MQDPTVLKVTREVCLFCPNSADSGEHLFSDWLRELFPLEEQHGGYTTLRAQYINEGQGAQETHRIRRKHKAPVGTIRIYVVCEKCNMGWMSRQENATKPILLPLILGETVTLERGQVSQLERWIAKTSAVNEAGFPTPPTIPVSDLERIKAGSEIQAHWHIWLGRVHDGEGMSVSYNCAHFPLIAPDGAEIDGSASCSVFLIGDLLIFVLVSALLDLGVNEPSFAGKLRKVRGAGALQWPPEQTLSDGDVLKLIEALAIALEAPRSPEGGGCLLGDSVGLSPMI